MSLKLGTQTGSLVNHVYSRSVIGQPEPVEGMGVTLLGWTDRHAGTIVATLQLGSIVYVRRDKARRTDKNGLSESQTWEFEADPNGALYIFRRAKGGQWHEVRVNETTGRFNKVDGYGLRLGVREEYFDFSF